MTASIPSDSILERARALADAGAWSEVLALLEPRAATCQRDGASALLYGEALIYTGNERKAVNWLRGTEPRLGDVGDKASQRRAVNMIGAACLAIGELDDASGEFARALELATHSEDANERAAERVAEQVSAAVLRSSGWRVQVVRRGTQLPYAWQLLLAGVGPSTSAAALR